MPDVTVPSEALERFLREIGVRRSTSNAGFSRPLAVDASMSLREWNVQGRIIKNTGSVTVQVRFDEQAAEPYPLGPGKKLRRTFSRVFVTYARTGSEPTTVDGQLRAYSETDEEAESGGASGSSTNGAVPNRAAWTRDNKNVAAAGTAENLSALPIPDGFGLVIKAKATNTGKIELGETKAIAEGASPYRLVAGEFVKLYITNANLVWVDATVNGEGVELIVEQ
jgi:hypothetical protein